MNAGTQETLISGFAALAAALSLQEKDEQDQILIIQAVRRWLLTHTAWLLILDNVEDLSQVESLLPSVSGGHVLLTTRSQITGRFAQRLEIDTLRNEEGAQLLLRRAGLLSAQGSLEEAVAQDAALAKQINEELGGLPLALDQAGAYIDETACGLIDYQQRYQERQASLLLRRGKLASDHPEAVATTWSLSFEKVEQHNLAAADLLRLCAFLASDAIPEELLTRGAKELGDVLAPVAADAYQLDQAIAALRAYSLIARDPQAQTLSIHRLVQAVLRDSMSADIQRQWMQHAAHAVEAAYPDPNFANWPLLERLLPHMKICATWIEQMPFASARLLNQIGYYLHARGRYTEAELHYQRALQITEQQLGATHLEVASVLEALAKLYNTLRKYEEAESLYQRALRIREHTLGVEHPEVTYSLNGLASLYSKLGRYKEAESLYQRALRIREHTLGVEHPEVASVLNNLAILYSQQGKYTEAEPLYKRALKIRELTLGAEHPDVAYSLNGLARLYEKQGLYTEAEPLYKRALKIRELTLGAEHPDVAYSLVGLADIYENQGLYAEAEPLYKRALKIRELAFGARHSEVVYIKNKLASLGRRDEGFGGGGGDDEDIEEEE